MFKLMAMLLGIVVFSSCKKEFANPYDSQTPGESWMPSNLAYTITGNNSVELTWQQSNMDIDGFTIVKRKNNVDEAFEVDKSPLKFIDAQVVNITQGETCADVSYVVYARAGQQKSNTLFLPKTLQLPLPTTANAGNDISAQNLSVNLGANAPTYGSGSWSIVSGAGGSFTNANLPTATFTGTLGQVYELAWTITLCNATSSDKVEVSMPLFLPGEGLTDIDGNIYSTNIIGEQEWMTENLKTSKFNNGASIPEISVQSDWAALSSGNFSSGTAAWCYYNNDVSNNAMYGKLYNYYVISDSRGLCPTGWHVPSDGDWAELINYLGGDQVAGGKMKSEGIQYWWSPNTGADNRSGLTALPGGLRFGNGGAFSGFGGAGHWWSANEYATSLAFGVSLFYEEAGAFRYNSVFKPNGLSVRCIKD